MYSPVQIANKFITLGNQHHNPLTHMQLQKLTYIAHGYYLALTGKPLLNECVSAWKYGPVILECTMLSKTMGINLLRM